ncbi:glycoside hydrolase family 108 protein [Deinococcus peraridilitoris]|uniref:Putative secretion activating protein n=1 Tax=Deinococcus peraridilitoris (strain DSM 19664 / LMG 22246 / CIP 109416 / KR-200) TaxID=937777 RepID=K9ZZ75_DEIPD|nr:glycosyl hydrolase 108 family protein [Deinococcus peraridilitoris]AFZ66055.1 putative secretion activating protein [Deinococcus peraridilitoris DSM 19664]
MTDFERALRFTLRWEGGKVDDPFDRGGRTNCGITQGTFNAWCKAQGRPPRDVWSITPAEVAAIYRQRYWNRVTAGRVWPLNAVCFDIAVNHGPGNLGYMLKQAKAQVPMGTPNMQTEIARELLVARGAFYRAIVRHNPTQLRFMRGWTNRLNDLRRFVALEEIT